MRPTAVSLGLLMLVAAVAPGDSPPQVVLPREATGLERHAAGELARYLRAMSSQEVVVTVEGRQGARPAIFVGRTVGPAAGAGHLASQA